MEDTIQDSQPIELYEFSSNFQSYYYTSDNNSHSYGGQTYIPIPGLDRTSILIGTQEDDRDEIEISVPLSAQVALDWSFDITPPDLECTIRRLDRSGGAYILWKGPVSSIKVKGHLSYFKCPTRFSNILQGNIPTVMVQSQCNHVLYDSLCAVSRVANSYTTTVSSVNGREITLNSAGGLGDSHFISGEILVTSTGERRTIFSKTSNVIVVNYSMIINPGDTVELAAGCDRSWNSSNGCLKFSNQENFGGFPFVPGESKNIFVVGI